MKVTMLEGWEKCFSHLVHSTLQWSVKKSEADCKANHKLLLAAPLNGSVPASETAKRKTTLTKKNCFYPTHFLTAEQESDMSHSGTGKQDNLRTNAFVPSAQTCLSCQLEQNSATNFLPPDPKALIHL